MPEDSVYEPLFVGAEGKKSIGYRPDNTGDNISAQNPCFCELTGLYFAWKNITCDALGLVHYRRHFTVKSRRYRRTHKKIDCVLTREEAEERMKMYDVVVPKKRKYYIETLYSHYAHTFSKEHLDMTEKIIVEKFPRYEMALQTVYHRTWGYMFNMFLMKKELVEDYCNFLFPILFELQNRLDIQDMTDFEKRLFGRVSEILFNVWLLNKQETIKLLEIPQMDMENVNWVKKGSAFLTAKFFGKKYKKSF